MDLWEFDAVGTACLLRDGEVTAGEVLEATVARIEAHRDLNAVVIDLFDRARQRTAAGVSGPFAGVPLLLKDACQELAGTPHWVGTAVLHQGKHRSATTTPLASLFEQLGFVIVGKGNVPELSVSSSTESAEFGATHNPYRRGTTAGGSSGGCAAAVAARLTPVAHGSDGSGSLRIPASACGLLTLKPSRGRGPASLPAAGDVDLSGCGLSLCWYAALGTSPPSGMRSRSNPRQSPGCCLACESDYCVPTHCSVVMWIRPAWRPSR